MYIELCSSCGQTPAEYSQRILEIDADKNRKPVDNSNDQSIGLQTTKLDLSRPLDISA